MVTDDNILAKEIVSWKGFEYALRQPNAALFNKMLRECLESEEYAAAFKTKGPQDSVESLLIALIFQQQKMISHLIEKIQNSQKKEK
jgi:hypothetical protein